MEISRGFSGWARVGGGPDATLFVRFADTGAVMELFMASDQPDGITAADLRSIPLAKISAVALSRPDLFKAWIANEGEGEPDLRVAVSKLAPPLRMGKSLRVTLEPPTHRGLDDDFLRRVADAYLSAVANGERPNKALAAQVGHPNTRTVERWVYLARKRGFLPRAHRGAVG